MQVRSAPRPARRHRRRPLPRGVHRILIGAGMAVISVAAAAILTLLLWTPFFSRNPLCLFYAAVVLCAWFGGMITGLFASIIAVAAIEYLLMPSFASGVDSIIHLTSFGFIAFLISWLDTHRRRATEALKRAKESAESANRAKDRFLATLSHELRTPLTPALAMTAAMELDSATPESMRDDLLVVRRNIELEARLIDDLLDLTRITSGKLQLRRSEADVHELIQHAIQTCRGGADGKRVVIKADPLATRSRIHGDPARVQQILWNLINNAVKFVPDGGLVHIQTADDGQMIRVSVTDNGIGIEPDAIERVFERFEQASPQTHREYGGLGLGLSISRALAWMHGGTLTACSGGTGTGSTFIMTLPTLAPSTAPPAPEPARRPVARHRGGVRLLLVEDHDDTAQVIARLLRAAGYQVTVAGCVRQAVVAAEREAFDLVVSDLGLPDGSGIDLMAGLQARYGLGGIAMTGYGTQDDLDRTRAAGFAAHVTKPVDIAVLRDRIDHLAGVDQEMNCDATLT